MYCSILSSKKFLSSASKWLGLEKDLTTSPLDGWAFRSLEYSAGDRFPFHSIISKRSGLLCKRAVKYSKMPAGSDFRFSWKRDVVEYAWLIWKSWLSIFNTNSTSGRYSQTRIYSVCKSAWLIADFALETIRPSSSNDSTMSLTSEYCSA